MASFKVISRYKLLGDLFLGTIPGEIQPGIWIAKIRTESLITGCRVQVRVQSTIEMYTGFLVNNIHTDYSYSEPASNPGQSNIEIIWFHVMGKN